MVHRNVPSMETVTIIKSERCAFPLTQPFRLVVISSKEIIRVVHKYLAVWIFLGVKLFIKAKYLSLLRYSTRKSD